MLRMRFALLVAVVAVTAHDATYLVGHGLEGYPVALGATGHDGHWLPVAIGVAMLLLGATTVAVIRWHRLRHQLAASGRRAGAAPHRIGPILPGALRLGARLSVAAVAVFVLQENLEAIARGASAPGPVIILAPTFLAAVPAIAVVSLLFAVMSELIDARILRLERALTAARQAVPRPSTAVRRAGWVAAFRQMRSRSSHPDLGRAPPASAHA